MTQTKHIKYSVTSTIDLIQFHSGPMNNFQYLIADTKNKKSVVIDPAWSIEPIISLNASLGLSIDQIWITHGHFDHVNQLNNLVNALNGTPTISLHRNQLFTPDSSNRRYIAENDVLLFGDSSWRILETPGHSPDSVCFLSNDHLICGDVLFVDTCGRSDLPGSDPEALWNSLFRLSKLPTQTEIFPGHDFGPRPTDTIEKQLITNPYLMASAQKQSVRNS